MLLLPLPRRHRRRLLLPPGLLALAWLLWLGCVAVPQLRGMKQQTVMQITMPPLLESGNLSWGRPYDASVLELEHFRPWQNFKLTGNLWLDYFDLRTLLAAYRQLHSFPNDEDGIRVTLGPQSTYGHLVQLYDWANQYELKRYWLDIRHEPITFYLYTVKGSTAGIALWNDVVNIDAPPPVRPTSKARILNWLSLISAPATYIPLLTPDWRNSLLLLLLIGSLNAVRIWRR
ncbi:hypothetical protein [Hymenobacter rubripertinctus]|uniref:Uncharacterized protein n=1 Tax=Hymenobacter rubripertinctus TaxID=2029981 RepID=A0A418QZE8_9BACT|nr:hypothetical protein [Hymenobacter rubripertinctus]RIY10519.1 hypothetical protein D0T11_09995 [Hymenobacter rubripertinctus]